MALDPTTPRSRRALLAAAAGGAAAVAASAAAPASVLALPTAVLTETANTSTAETSLSMTSATAADVTLRIENTTTTAAALVGAAGDQTNIATDLGFTGIYGWSPTADPDPDHVGSGVWGDGEDIGVVGTGGIGVEGDGFYGVVAFGANNPAAVGLIASGWDGTGNYTALDVRGKAKFSRSGRATIGAGKSSIKINLAGVTWSSLVFAVLRSNRSGRYVRAVVPTTGSFTIYLNTSVTSSTYVVWFVVN